uniref:Bromodomain adjacent to zinc finger domain protein 1A n=1 Tax=Corethrella appendiculata TaxID=1370023 RepID=W4VS83_9DIPT
MPLLRKKNKNFEDLKDREALKDNEEVFFCEQTKEIFRNYEDYFQRVMLLNSMVWSCSLTGKTNLTYDEALESEKAARKILRKYPQAMKSPVIMVAAQTKRCAINELMDDVFGYVKDHYFKNEEIECLSSDGKFYIPCKVLECIPPASSNKASPIKASSLKYRVEEINDNDSDDDEDCKIVPDATVRVVPADQVRRDRFTFTKDKCRLFVKQHIDLVDGMLKIKDASYKKFVTDEKIKFDDIFFGKPPDFELSKRLILDKQKAEERAKAGVKPKAKKNTTNDKQKSTTTTTKSKDGKQQTMTKYLNKSTEGKSTDASSSSKPPPKDPEKEKKLKEEMERVRKENAAREAERQKKLAEERVELLTQVSIAYKKYNQIQDDQELQDHRPLPVSKPVSSIIGGKHFSDFIHVLEFMTSFAELLSIRDKFPHGLSMELLERALVKKEVNGPLSDILQVLLSTIFSLQVEEENEVEIAYETSAEYNESNKRVVKTPADTAAWCIQHYSTKLNELPMDSTTISELLRLHFLSSGAAIKDQGAKWRYAQRGGYQSSDDPGQRIINEYPHILRLLSVNTVFQLSTTDVLKILTCLVDQLLTYGNVRDLIDDRLEKARAAKQQLQVANSNKRKREQKANAEKIAMREDSKKKVAALEGNSEDKIKLKKELDEKMEKEFARIDADTEREVGKILKEIEQCKENFFDYQMYLGSDRAYRNYWLFESLPGLFVEHNTTFAGKCRETPIKYIPGLANCPTDKRYAFIKQIIMNSKASNDKENISEDIENAMAKGTYTIQTSHKTGDKNLNTSQPPPSSALPPNGSVVKKDHQNLTHKDLLMCTANSQDCPVHSAKYPERSYWSYYSTEEEIRALIDGLNSRGVREKQLRENLELEKVLIVNHIKMCPIEKVSFNADDHEKIMNEILTKTARRYDQANLNHEPGTDASVIFDSTLRENLLDMEAKITVGYLGFMKVKDRFEWRQNIENGTFNELCAALKFGPSRLHDGGGGGNESSDTGSEKYPIVDPGSKLPDTPNLESEDSSDEMVPFVLSDKQKETIHSWSTALLQIEQAIDSKFFRHPFGPKKELKDKVAQAKKIAEGQKYLTQWEESLMRSTTYAQVFLHYNVLFDAVQWSRSIEKIACMICRRKGDPNMTLLCDDCNKACHMYCLKPKLKEIPAGDWFCPKCKPENYKENRGRKRKIFVEKEELEEEEEEEFGREVYDDSISQEDSQEDDAGEKCKECKVLGADIKCTKCKHFYHMQCTNLNKTPKKHWHCDSCKTSGAVKKKGTEKKAKKQSIFKIRPVSSDNEAANGEDDDDDVVDEEVDEGEEEEEIVNSKKSRKSKQGDSPSGRRSGRASLKQQKDEESSGTSRRSVKRKLLQDDEESDSDLPKKRRRDRHSTGTQQNGFHNSSENSEESDDDSDLPLARSRKRRSKKQSSSPEDAKARRSRRTGDDLPLHSVNLYTLLDDIIKHQDSWPFNRPVSVKEVPDYYKIIEKPMDFARVKSNLNMGKYKNNFDIMDDVQLVFANCDLYNTNESEIYKAGIRLERYVEKRCKELCLPFKASDMIKTEIKKNGIKHKHTTTTTEDGSNENGEENGDENDSDEKPLKQNKNKKRRSKL